MITIYRILFPIIATLLSPYYLRRMLRRGGYEKKLAHRFGHWPRLEKKVKGNKRIWLQAVSVGEVSSLSKLLPDLAQEKNLELFLSGTTSTGLQFAEKLFGPVLKAHGPFPLDWFPFSRRAWNRIDPDLVIMVDSELWPEHFHQALSRGVPIFIINARLSDRSYSRLRKIPFLHPLIFPKNLTIVTASERQSGRWKSLGLPEASVRTAGNLKIDAVRKDEFDRGEKNQLIEEFGFSEDSIVLAGISTWNGEEKLLIEIAQSLRLENIDLRLLLIPRHAERREQVIRTLHSCQLPFQVRSQGKQAVEGNVVYLADTTGELSRLIRAADFGFLGKTLPPNQGGQNPIEPIALGLPLVVGPNHQNFHETCTDMFLQGAALQTHDEGEVRRTLMDLAKSEEKRAHLRNASREWMRRQGSPSDYTLELIRERLAGPDF